jgi:peroxiredoxin
VVGITVDPVEINRRQSQKRGYTFPLLSDPKAKVIRVYDVLHAGRDRKARTLRAQPSFCSIPAASFAG